jgi:hypothetical protein
MGCDIHMYAERYNREDRKWEKVGNEFLSDYSIYFITKHIENEIGCDTKLAENILNKYLDDSYNKNLNPKNIQEKLEKYIFNYLNENLPPKDKVVSWSEVEFEGKLLNLYTDTPYGGRNYELFGVLAGVRSNEFDSIDYPRGLPEDVTEEIKNKHQEWDVDAHSATYYSLDELLDSDYRKMSVDELVELRLKYFFKDVLDTCLKLTDNPSDFRLVFWFDN